MIRTGGDHVGAPGEDTEFCGLVYPDGDILTSHMADRLRGEPFYQHDKLKEALSFVRLRRVAVDCGAWVGGWSRELARHFQTVVSIEANADSARCVRQNVKQSGNVTVLHLAVSDRNGTAIACPQAEAANVGSRIVPIGNTKSAFDVVLRRIDAIEEIQALPAIDYIKIHVNGMEFKALHGATETIKKHRPVLTVVLKPALADYEDTPKAARAYLTDVLRYRRAAGEKPYEIWTPA